jgi:hypothetical protein
LPASRCWNPRLPTLPDEWEGRQIKVSKDGVTAHFLEPHAAAVSKLARGEERDIRWVTAGAKANILSLPTVRIRMNSTMFLDDEEHRSAVALVEKVKKALPT